MTFPPRHQTPMHPTQPQPHTPPPPPSPCILHWRSHTPPACPHTSRCPPAPVHHHRCCVAPSRHTHHAQPACCHPGAWSAVQKTPPAVASPACSSTAGNRDRGRWRVAGDAVLQVNCTASQQVPGCLGKHCSNVICLTGENTAPPSALLPLATASTARKMRFLAGHICTYVLTVEVKIEFIQPSIHPQPMIVSSTHVLQRLPRP